jgi:hypothetical protein
MNKKKKLHRKNHSKANYERVKTWRRENPEMCKLQKQRERCAKRMQWKEALKCSHETEVFVNIFLTFIDPHNPIPIINFECDEGIASEQQQQDLEDLYEVIASEKEQDLVADFDLSLLDV